MTERERWVVYPLLFLALGASLRDKLGGSLTAKRIVCQELRIEDEAAGNEQPRTLALIGRTEPSPNAPSVGELYVDGIVKVDGVVSSKEFQSGNQRIIPAPRYVPLPQDYIEALRAGRLRPQSAPQSTSPKQNASPDAASPSSPPEQKGDVLPPSKKVLRMLPQTQPPVLRSDWPQASAIDRMQVPFFERLRASLLAYCKYAALESITNFRAVPWGATT